MATMDYNNLYKLTQSDDSALLVGESTISRTDMSSSSVTSGSGSLRLTFFTAKKNETISNVRVITGGTPAAATPTLCRVGIYVVDPATNDLTLVGSTANDVNLFSVASTVYNIPLQVPFVKYKGLRYAVGILVVSGAATPNFQGTQSTPASEAAMPPRMVGYSAQADLPATITDASLTQGANQFYVALY